MTYNNTTKRFAKLVRDTIRLIKNSNISFVELKLIKRSTLWKELFGDDRSYISKDWLKSWSKKGNSRELKNAIARLREINEFIKQHRNEIDNEIYETFINALYSVVNPEP